MQFASASSEGGQHTMTTFNTGICINIFLNILVLLHNTFCLGSHTAELMSSMRTYKRTLTTDSMQLDFQKWQSLHLGLYFKPTELENWFCSKSLQWGFYPQLQMPQPLFGQHRACFAMPSLATQIGRSTAEAWPEDSFSISYPQSWGGEDMDNLFIFSRWEEGENSWIYQISRQCPKTQEAELQCLDEKMV